MLLAGGIMQHGYQCGMVWGATLAAGARAYHMYGPGPRAELAAIRAGGQLADVFRDQNRHVNCLEITEIDKSSTTWKMISFFLFRGGVISCVRRATRYAPAAFEEINAVLSQETGGELSYPVSCSAELARRMGASDLHATMVSGFAGGIGLRGGGCGALAAAIWLAALSRNEDAKVTFEDPRAVELIDRFRKHTDYELECSRIVGREFERIEDHAAFVRNGGCAGIIDTLSSGESPEWSRAGE